MNQKLLIDFFAGLRSYFLILLTSIEADSGVKREPSHH